MQKYLVSKKMTPLCKIAWGFFISQNKIGEKGKGVALMQVFGKVGDGYQGRQLDRQPKKTDKTEHQNTKTDKTERAQDIFI